VINDWGFSETTARLSPIDTFPLISNLVQTFLLILFDACSIETDLLSTWHHMWSYFIVYLNNHISIDNIKVYRMRSQYMLGLVSLDVKNCFVNVLAQFVMDALSW